jgi:hypothetical protein
LLFAFQHALSTRSSAGFFLDGWLLFRDIAPDGKIHNPPGERAESAYTKYLGNNSEGLSWANVSTSWSALVNVSWNEHHGFRELNRLLPRSHRQDTTKTELPQRFHAVSRFVLCCSEKGCSRRYIVDPDNRKLAYLHPVVCKGCGHVLVPDRLVVAFEGKR